MGRPRDTSLPLLRVCEVCGKEFERKPGLYSNKTWANRKTCDAECWKVYVGERSRRLAAEGRHPAMRPESREPNTGRARARAAQPERRPCEICGEPGERHHADGDTFNNEPSNIVWLCRLHHMERHFGPPRDAEHAAQRARNREKGRRWRERQRASSEQP